MLHTRRWFWLIEVRADPSEIEPKRNVGDDTAECHHSPHHFVSCMSLRVNRELSKFIDSGYSGEDLAMLFIEVNHVKHDLSSFVSVGQLGDQGQLCGLHTHVLVGARRVIFWVLGLGVATVKNTADCAHHRVGVVKSLILEILRNPASVDEDSLFFTSTIKMGVERSDDVNTFLSILVLGNLDLARVIKDALDWYGFHWPFRFELSKVSFVTGPNVGSLVSGRDVSRWLSQLLLATRCLWSLLLSAAVLVLSCLVHEYCV